MRTQQTPGIPYLPFAAFSSMMLALLEWRESFARLDGGGELMVVGVCEGWSEPSRRLFRIASTCNVLNQENIEDPRHR